MCVAVRGRGWGCVRITAALPTLHRFVCSDMMGVIQCGVSFNRGHATPLVVGGWRPRMPHMANVLAACCASPPLLPSPSSLCPAHSFQWPVHIEPYCTDTTPHCPTHPDTQTHTHTHTHTHTLRIRTVCNMEHMAGIHVDPGLLPQPHPAPSAPHPPTKSDHPSISMPEFDWSAVTQPWWQSGAMKFIVWGVSCNDIHSPCYNPSLVHCVWSML